MSFTHAPAERPARRRPRLEFRLLGPLEVRVDGKPIPLRGTRQRAVLACLLLAQGQVVPTDRLAEEAWDGRPPSTVRTQVTICVAALRKLFRAAGCPDDVIVTEAPGYRLALDGHEVDSGDFARRLGLGYEAARQGRTARAAAELKGALDLWRGRALAGVSAEFAEAEAERLAEQRMLATEQWLILRLELGEHRSLIGDLTRLIRANPLREQLRGALMLAQYRAGQRAAALRTYREARSTMIEELGLEPGVELRLLHEAIIRDDSAVAAPVPVPVPAGASGRSPAERGIPAQLHADVVDFIGREDELALLDGLLVVDAGSSTAFVAGAPGSGRTALAMHWAHRSAARFPDGQLYADLAAGADAAARETPYDGFGAPVGSGVPWEGEQSAHRVLRRFLYALGVSPQETPATPEESEALYRSLLADRRVLIVLDNAADLAQVRPLLPGGGRSAVLVTGSDRSAAGRGMLRVHLDPLPVGDAAALLRRLTGCPSEETVDRLAGLCGGLPLALHAAASLLAARPHWTIGDLVARLADERRCLDTLDRGAGGLRDSFRRAYDALEHRDAEAFRRLGAAEAARPDSADALRYGGFDAGTAAAALGAGGEETEDALENLVDLQMLRVVGPAGAGPRRYRFPELLRLFAAELHAGAEVGDSCSVVRIPLMAG